MNIENTSVRPGRRLLPATLLAALASFVVLLFYSLLTFPRDRILAQFITQWSFTQAGLYLFEFLMPVLSSVYMVAFSLKPLRIIPKNNEQTARKILLFFIVITFFATFFNEIFLPRLNYRLGIMETATNTAKDFHTEAMKALKREDYPKALNYLDLYASMNPGDTSIQALLDRTRSRAERQEFIQNTEPPRNQPAETRVADMSAEDLYALAEEYYGQEDYRSAFYYSSIAERLGHPEASSLNRAARENLAGKGPAKDTRQTWDLYAREQEGLSLLEYERYIEAYYHFLNLSKQYPADPDIDTYLAQSREKVQEAAFFYEEIERYLVLPGTRDVVFLNRRENGEWEFISIRTMFQDADTYFFEDIEVFRTDETENVIAHYLAPYGKYQNGGITLTCISRDDPLQSYLPEDLPGAPGGPNDRSILLTLSPKDLKHFTSSPYSFENTGLFELADFLTLFPKHGLRKEPVIGELMRRALYPFTFLVMVLLFSSAGLHWKKKRYEVSFLAYLAVPLIPFVLHFLILGFLDIEKKFLNYIILKTGMFPAFAVFLAVQGILFFFALAVFMRKVLRKQ